MADEETEMKTKTMKAGAGQLFLCEVCSKTFFDREAKVSLQVTKKDWPAQVEQVTPDSEYPDIRKLDKHTWVDEVFKKIEIKEADAGECCATNVVLCSSDHLRFRKVGDDFMIVGAERME